ncbi:DinB family protein [Geomesophilobacter sediminis]|uniref:DinB family protein n=1 Tax=Geomesophilobacter sediminis TaxID=2798584 RepID=A0A8J7JET7_9BACT|nr:DinB family protein [Geomesophilobacter sediminis]MBJ6726263.1 DinB family protein [Geomesophilobacter sediminis]
MELPAVQFVQNALNEAFALLDDVFEIGPGAMSFRPDYDGAWTIAEHLEHVSLVNHFLLLTIGKGCRTALKRAQLHQPPPEESDLAILDPVARPEAFEWPPPAHMIPSGMVELSETKSLLRQQKERCLELLYGMPNGEGRLYNIRMSVNNLGRLDMYQWIYFLIQHARYHLVLIERRKEEFRLRNQGPQI